MQVKIEDVSPVEKKLIVSVPWMTVDSRMGDAFRELAKSVNLKGFRKGKVPRTVLERMFGKRVRAEVAVQLVRESFVTAVTEHNLQAVSEPRVEDVPEIKTGQPFSFAAVVEVRGDIEVGEWKGMQLGKRPVKLDESAVDMALQQLREEQTELRPIENREQLADGDVVAVSVKGSVGEHPIDWPQLVVDLASGRGERLPGLSKALIGLPIKSEGHALELKLPDEEEHHELRGQTANLTVSVLDAREKDVPELDDELAKDTGRAETLDELRAAVRKELEERVRTDIRDEVRKDALAELVKRNPIPVAASLVDRAVESKYQRLRQMLGMEPGEGGELDSDLREKLRSSSLDEVRGQLLLDSIANAENIEVAAEEIDERVARLARAQGQQPGRLRQEMERDGRLDGLSFQIRQEKTLDRLIEHAEVTEREPPPPEPEAPVTAATEDAPDAPVPPATEAPDAG
jgi:trigger factor